MRKKIIKRYKDIALVILNTIVFFILINVGLYAIMLVRRPFLDFENRNYERYGKEKVIKAYPDLNPQEVTRLMEEGQLLKQEYDPFVGYKPTVIEGNFYNIANPGFRKIHPDQKWPPETDKNIIFVFGGSTTFGAGIKDEETIPARMQHYLEKKGHKGSEVYNLGRGGYYTGNELHFFLKLLSYGIIPNHVVFIDGYNDFMYYEKEIYGEDRLRGLLSGQIQSKQKKFTDHLPIVKVAKKILQKIKFKQKTQNPEGEEKYPHRYLPVSKEPDAKLSFVIDRYLRNIKMIESISSEFGIDTTFVWQPCPMYNFDVKRHLFFDGGWGNFSQNKRGYTRFKELQKSGQLPLKNIVFGGDWHPTSGPPLYIDNLHYSAGFSDVIAEKIVESMVWE